MTALLLTNNCYVIKDDFQILIENSESWSLYDVVALSKEYTGVLPNQYEIYQDKKTVLRLYKRYAKTRIKKTFKDTRKLSKFMRSANTSE